MRLELMDRLPLDCVRGRHLLIALSGGADSVALLSLLRNGQQKYALRLTAAHYNHHIRGEEADGDMAFCRQLCQEMEIPFIEGGGDVPAEAARLGIGIETAAREMRYRFLYETMERCGADRLALAHHLNDQAETVLMHLLRGCGTEGITGMRLQSGKLFRPLLGISKAELVDYLLEAGISWREDATNALADTPRNALRLNVLPEIEKSYPSAAEAIARFSRLARIENDFVGRATERFYQERVSPLPNGFCISLKDDWEEALLRRALRCVCGMELLSAKVDELIALSRKSRGRTEVSKLWKAEKTPFALYLLRKDAKKPSSVPFSLNGETCFHEICRISAVGAPLGSVRNSMNEEILDGDCLEGACIRHYEPGDWIRPLGMAGKKLLSDYFTDKKIDRPLRESWPLLAKGNEVLWVCGVGISENVKTTPDTRRAVKLTYTTNDNAEG